MKRTLALLSCLVWLHAGGYAQTDEQPQTYALQTSSTILGVSSMRLLDNYISPLPYDGSELNLTHIDRRYIRPETALLSSMSRTRVQFGRAYNPARTALVLAGGLNYTWGMYYHFRPVSRLQILAGGSADADLAVKYLTRNVNNPINVDLATNLNLSAAFIYDLPLGRRSLRLQAELESPWIGCMFAPEQGSSYYEIFDLGAKGRFVHFSSFHNKLALRQDYFVELPFAHSCWRVGFHCSLMKWTANGLVFQRNDIGGYVGFTRTLTRFSRKNPAPHHFIGI